MTQEIKKFAKVIAQVRRRQKLYISMSRGGEQGAARMSGRRLVILN
jgi:hypothetical protein